MFISVNDSELDNLQTIVEDLFIHTERVKCFSMAANRFFDGILSAEGATDPMIYDIVNNQGEIRCLLDVIAESADVLENNRALVEEKIWRLRCSSNTSSSQEVRVFDPFN